MSMLKVCGSTPMEGGHQLALWPKLDCSGPSSGTDGRTMRIAWLCVSSGYGMYLIIVKWFE